MAMPTLKQPTLAMTTILCLLSLTSSSWAKRVVFTPHPIPSHAFTDTELARAMVDKVHEVWPLPEDAMTKKV